jgi:carbon-monoxide dehydrogenase small subunit
MNLVNVKMKVNGVEYERTVEPRMLLSDFIRHELCLTGTHVGCEHGMCGACTVLLDGESVRSCLMFAVQANGSAITTIEGIGTPENLHPIQQGFSEAHALQCGYCTPGFIMSIIPILEKNPHPTDEQILASIDGNICRCTGYENMKLAVRIAVERMAETKRSAEV